MKAASLARTALSGAGLSSAAFSAALGQDVAANDRPVETVVVTDSKLNLDLVPGKILDTPASINVVPATVIREQGVTSLQEALKNVPGITLNAGEGGTHGDLVNLRGFSAGDDYFIDGLRDTGLYNRDVFDMQSIEVIKGPASTLFGRGTTGGTINQVSKMPELFPIDDFALTGGNNAEIRATADVNYVLGDDSAARVNLMGQRNNVVGRDFARTQKWGIAPTLAFGLGTDTVWSLKVLHQQEDDIPDYGVPFLFGLPAPVPHRAYYGLPSDDRSKSEVDVVTGKVTHRISDIFSVSDTARYGHYWFDSIETGSTYGSANCFNDAAPFTGAPLCSSLPAASAGPATASNPYFPVVGTPLNQVLVLRDRPSGSGTIATMMNEADATASFSTGELHHQVIAGIEVDKEDADLIRFPNQNTVIAPVPLLAPNPYEAFPGHQTMVRQHPLTKTTTASAFVTDTIDYGEQWSLVTGLRFDHFGAAFNQSLGTPTHFTHNDNIGSPRAALVYKPDENSSLYFSYGTSFNPSAETLSLAANNQALGPERDHTYEAGGKVNVLDGQLALTLAAFNTVKTNARITDPLNPSLQSLAGTERVNGVELGAQGRISENWELTAGYTYLAPRAVGLIATGVAGPIPNVARNQGNIWTVYDFDNGLKLGAGLNWTGRRDAGADTMSVPGQIITDKVPSFVTADAMASYPVNDNFVLQLNVYNLANEFYYADSYFVRPVENHAIPGAGRTLLLTAELSL
jgi:catecholate siderophore receptor